MKKITINSEVLLTALQTVAKAFGKSAVPIIESYLFQVSNGMLTVSATDLQTTFRLTFNNACVDIKKGVEFLAVVPPTIVKYLQKIDRQPITFAWDGESYSIEILTDENERAKYSGDNPEKFPTIKTPTDTLFETTSCLFNEFSDLLNYVSKDELRPAMTGIGVINHKGAFTMTATDGHALKTVVVPELSDNTRNFSDLEKKAGRLKAVYSKLPVGPCARKVSKLIKERIDVIENELSKQLFIIPSKPAKILAGLTFGTKKKPEPVAVVCRKSVEKSLNNSNEIIRLSFAFPYESFQAEVIFRDIDERFPQFWNVIPERTQTKTTYTGQKDKFLKIVDKALLFANKTTHQIRVCLNGTNKVSAEDLDFSNEYNGEIGGTYSGEPIEIGFNGEFLSKAVKSFGASFDLELIAPNKAGVIRDERCTVLVMPVMLHQSKSAEELARELNEARREAREEN